MSDALNRGAPSADQLRRDLLGMVMRDLQGPAAGPEEEIAERSVRDRYLVGMLAPKHQVIFPEEQDKLETDTGETVDEGTPDASAVPSKTMFPVLFRDDFQRGPGGDVDPGYGPLGPLHPAAQRVPDHRHRGTETRLEADAARRHIGANPAEGRQNP